MTLAADVPTPALPPSARQLLSDLHRLPAQRPALLRVVQLADDPDFSVRMLADAVATDPAFTARLLELANSAYYGRSGRVTSIVPAVNVIGAETLRGLAVTMVLGLAGENGPLPAGFCDRSAITAVGSRLVAPHVRAESGDAFCVGLLREVGQALLFRAAPHAYGRLLDRCDDESALAAAELAWCGTTNAELAAAALAAAGLPDSVCETIARHQLDHRKDAASSAPLTRALRGGSVLARAVASGEVDDAVADALAEVTDDVLDARAARALTLQAAAEAAALSAAMR